jgi:phage portal protein BeeE
MSNPYTDWWVNGVSDSSTSSAAHLVPVFASIRVIVDYISTLPIDFYRKNPDGSRQPVGPPELIRNADEETGLSTWFGQIAHSIVTRGNSVGEVLAAGQSGPTRIRWASDWSSNDAPEQPWWLNGRALPDKKVAHIPWIVPAGKRLGLSPIEHYAAMVTAGLAAQDYANVARGGGLPPSVMQNTLLSEMPAELISAASAAAAAAFATNKPFVHGKDWKFEAITIPPNHAQFIETLKLTATQIAAIYGLDPREVGGSAADSLTYSNDESRALNRAHNLRPYLVRIEDAVSRWIADSTFMRFNVDATIRADISTRTTVIGAQIADGRLSVNEARALEDRPPVPGGEIYNIKTPIQQQPSNRGDRS